MVACMAHEAPAPTGTAQDSYGGSPRTLWPVGMNPPALKEISGGRGELRFLGGLVALGWAFHGWQVAHLTVESAVVVGEVRQVRPDHDLGRVLRSRIAAVRALAGGRRCLAEPTRAQSGRGRRTRRNRSVVLLRFGVGRVVRRQSTLLPKQFDHADRILFLCGAGVAVVRAAGQVPA